MSNTDLLNFYNRYAAAARPLVLASVYETEGSTYSKPGARMLISDDGQFQGMLSGGCLEGDLAARAAQVIASGRPQQATYDLGLNAEELWGLGIGCDGLMRIFLQALVPAADYEPFATMARLLDGEQAVACATVLQGTGGAPAAGSSLVLAGNVESNFGLTDAWRGPVAAAARQALAEGHSRAVRLGVDGGEAELLLGVMQPPLSVLVLGAGLDAEPVVRLCAELGWRVTVQDHRPAYIAKGNFSPAQRVHCVPADQLPGTVDLDAFDGAIIMSHHLATDRVYLGQLAATGIRYIGLLGPRHRRERLLEDLGTAAGRLEGRLHGPAGLDIGGRGPSSIALSIVAEMHRHLIGTRDGY